MEQSRHATIAFKVEGDVITLFASVKDEDLANKARKVNFASKLHTATSIKITKDTTTIAMSYKSGTKKIPFEQLHKLAEMTVCALEKWFMYATVWEEIVNLNSDIEPLAVKGTDPDETSYIYED